MLTHQNRVAAWMTECFGEEISSDKVERNDRFIEEALELAQATGYTADRAHALVRYVYGRPAGEPGQEVGGVMVTLAALCNVHGIDIEAEATREVDRITTPEMVAKIRAKQASKPTGSALPVAEAGNASPLADAWPALKTVVFPRDEAGRDPDPVSFVLSLAAQPWALAAIAKLLRDAGEGVIARKAEAEYASALHWLLGLALRHGDGWDAVYTAEIARMEAVVKSIRADAQ